MGTATNEKMPKCGCDLYLSPGLCRQADPEKTKELYGQCKLNIGDAGCSIEPDIINNICGCSYCVNCIKLYIIPKIFIVLSKIHKKKVEI